MFNNQQTRMVSLLHRLRIRLPLLPQLTHKYRGSKHLPPPAILPPIPLQLPNQQLGLSSRCLHNKQPHPRRLQHLHLHRTRPKPQPNQLHNLLLSSTSKRQPLQPQLELRKAPSSLNHPLPILRLAKLPRPIHPQRLQEPHQLPLSLLKQRNLSPASQT